MDDIIKNNNTTETSHHAGHDKRLTEKQLLTDPVNYFVSSLPEDQAAGQTRINAISRLYQQRLSLEQQQKKLKQQTGVLSRQIGNAKQNHQSAEHLLTEMRTLSEQKKSLSKQIKQINQTILTDFFPAEPAKSRADADQRYSPVTPIRHNIDINIDINTIVIGKLDDCPHSDSLIQDTDWNHYVTANPAACIHHRTEWRDIHRQSHGHNSLYLYACDRQNKIVGILPMVQLKSRLFGNRLVSMPFFQRGGALAEHPLIIQKLIQAAAEYGRKLHVDHIEFRDTIIRETGTPGLPVETHKVNMILALPATDQALWQTFSSKLRSQIRRAQRESTEVMIGREELLDDFYRVYSHNMRDLGSPVQSRSFIANILSTFPQNSWLIVIRYQQRPVATGFLLASGNTLEIPLASTLRTVNPLSINMLLYHEVLKFAISRHFQQFDFGRSSKGGGTYRFKQQWGAKPMQLYWHYWLGKASRPPSLNASNPKYALVINTWKHLPLAIANRLGPLIVKNIP